MSAVEVLNPPIQSVGDKKEYRLIKLANGLKAILVRKLGNGSDSESLAAADVTIGVGSFDDPPNALGLAHYLEHIVHMGSVKYPEESAYNDFLSANGGKRNAMTGNQYTSYFFAVSEKAFPEALDRLEQIIEAPLLLKNSMQREREAVDSEFEMKKSLDAVRIQSILKLLVVDSHPASQFDFGNLKSLKDVISDDDLHNELLKIHSKYVGNKMYVALQSSRSLDEMQELVVSKFSSIKSGNDEEKKENAITNVDEFFKPDFYNKIFYVKPKTSKAILLTWPVPPVIKHYKCSPMDYVAKIFANEGEGGIISFLNQKHLVNSIAVAMEEYSFSSNTDFALVRIVADLTDLGSENIDQILEAIFSYLLMIQETSIEEHRRLYDDLKEKTERDFNFLKEAESEYNVMNFATNFLVYDDADVLRGNVVWQGFDGESISNYINALNQRKFNLMVITDKHANIDKREKYFGTEYVDEDFPESYKKLWDERKLNPEFFLEKPNPFKTTNFDILVNAEESPKYPVAIFDDEFIKVWHKLDNKFERPHVNIKVKMFSPIIKASAENSLMLSLFESVMSMALKKKLSEASSAGYSVSTLADSNGFRIDFEGFNDKIDILIDIVTKFLPVCMKESNEVSFNSAIERMKENFETKLKTPNGLNGEMFQKVLVQNAITNYDIYHLRNNITFEMLQKFSDDFFKSLRLEVLAQGNIGKNQTLSLAETLKTNLASEVVPEAFELKRQSYQVSLGSSVIRMKSLSPNDNNSLIKDFYQIGPGTLRVRDMARLVESILSPKVYDILRSKEQLGYGVSCKLDTKAGVVGLSLLVLSQESKHNYTKVYERMNAFMHESAAKVFEDLSDEDFEIFKESRVKTLSEDNRTLSDEANRNWAEIAEHDYVFDRYELAANDTATITKSELQEFFKSFTQPDNMRKLSVQVIGNSETGDDAEKNDFKVKFLEEKLSDHDVVITNIDEYHKELTVYPIVKFP